MVLDETGTRFARDMYRKTQPDIWIKLMPNTHRRRNETVLSHRRRRCEHNLQLAHNDCQRILLTIWKLTKQTP